MKLNVFLGQIVEVRNNEDSLKPEKATFVPISKKLLCKSVHRLKKFGQIIGQLEDSILSICHISRSPNEDHNIVLVDDFDEIVNAPDTARNTTGLTNLDERVESHSSTRALYAFLSAMDSFCNSLESEPNLTFICMARSHAHQTLARFDDVCKTDNPTFEERKNILSSFVKVDAVGSALNHLAELSVGLSYAEIAQNCRRLISDNPGLLMTTGGHCEDALVRALGESFQTFAPASLRSGIVDGFVDIRVWSAEDLLQSSPLHPSACPLYGTTNEFAWKELESNIVIPLCREKELNQILFDRPTQSSQGALSCGVILSGNPGSGKTSLARQCASFAASILPSVKLLEVSCTSMIHKEVGVSEKSIHHLFECARSAAPCVIILDDVAVISSVRGKDNTTEGTMDRVLSTLLTELDGVEKTLRATVVEAGIAVIGVTQDASWVDPALLRPGRLGRVVKLELPDRETRRKIALQQFGIDSINSLHEDSQVIVAELLDLVAEKTEGTTGSNVIAVCDNAKRACIGKYATDSERNLPQSSEVLGTILGRLKTEF